MRTAKGGALSILVIGTVCLILVGVGFFFLMKLIGGQRELQNAADAGVLSIAKSGVETPTVALTGTGSQRSPFEGLMDAKTGGLNLQTYNRAVGQAFLVALNAEAENSDAGIRNARQLIQTLQGPNGIGAKLAEKLSRPGTDKNSWVVSSFQPVAESNSLRMLSSADSNANVDFSVTPDSYAVSYVRPGADSLDSSNSNIELSQSFDKQVPLKNYGLDLHVNVPRNVKAEDKNKKYTSLRGYDPIKIGRVGSICAVTMSPFEQAHLVSNKYFSTNKVNPAANLGIVLPPNSFQTNISVSDKKSALPLDLRTSSIVGTSSIDIPIPMGNPYLLQLTASKPKYDLAIPRGYLIIDNQGDNQDSAYWGLLPQENTKAADWYGSTGVSVDTAGRGCFSNNGRLEEWMTYNFAKNLPGGALLPKPSLDGLYNQSGQPATLADAEAVTATQSPLPCHCNDLNSDPIAPGANLTCVKDATSLPYNPGVFDKAYFPNYLNPPVMAKSGRQLTAGELAKMKTWNLYLSNGIGALLVGINKTTGARLYPQAPEFPLNDPLLNMPTPYNAIPGTNFTIGVNTSAPALAYSDLLEPGQVTREGSILQLMRQVANHSVQKTASMELRRFLENRMWQIKPDATQAEIDSILESKTLSLRQKYYIYLDKDRKFTLSATRPFWIADLPSDPTPDGKTHPFVTAPFSLLGTLVNPAADFDIHEMPFLDSSGPTIFGVLSANFTPSSGANNLLGVVKFQETTFGAPVLFSNAN